MAITRSRIALWAAASGVLWALAWPAIGGLSFLAFFAWLPLLHAERLHDARTVQRRRSFMPYVLLAVFIWNAATSWWFFAVSESLVTRLVSGFAPMVINSLLMLLPWWLKRVVHRTVDHRAANYGFVFFWLAFEYLHHDWDLQWPWFSLGNVFGAWPTCIQWYEFTGMLGGSLWVLLVNFFLDRAVVQRIAEPRAARAFAVVALGVVVLPLSWSVWRYRTLDTTVGEAVEVVVVQPCIDPYTEKFGGVDPLRQLDRMLALAETVMTDSTALVVMPETALQEGATVDMSGPTPVFHGLWENDLANARSTKRLKDYQRNHPRAAFLTGMSADTLYPFASEVPTAARPLFAPNDPRAASQQRWYTSYNAALFLPTDGPVEHYNKSKLVAGVELMPFERVLGKLGDLALDLGGTSGSLGMQQEREVFVDATHDLRVIPAICYESVFGEHVAEHVRNGGNLIAIMTNDAWWSTTPGYKQHLTFASIRAIETRRDIARSANTGTSCFVDRRGAILQPTAWWVPIAIRGTVHLSDEITFFVRHGDQVGRVSLLCSGLLLLLSVSRRLRLRS